MKEEEKLTTKELYDLSHTAAAPLLAATVHPWEALPRIGDFIRELGASLSLEEYDHPQEDVWIHKTAKIYPNNTIAGPCVIGPETEVRPGAFIRGNALVGAGCVVGNSTELKNAILFDRVQVPHYNYVGDGILGYRAHLGAGAIASNVKSDHSTVHVRTEDQDIDTGLRKCSSMVGDFAEVGCGSVLCPGSILGRNSQVYPLTRVRGVLGENRILKAEGLSVEKIRSADDAP